MINVLFDGDKRDILLLFLDWALWLYLKHSIIFDFFFVFLISDSDCIKLYFVLSDLFAFI